MRKFKRLLKQIALTLAITLLVPMLAPAAKVSAAETKSSWTVEMGENSYLEYEETETVRKELGKNTTTVSFDKE